MATRQSVTSTQARVTSAIAGVKKNLSAVAQITLAGVVFTPATLLALLQAYSDLVASLLAAHNQLTACVKQERLSRTQVQGVLSALQAFVVNMFGSDPNKLGDFGFAPRRVGQETAETRHNAALKAAATRKARGTTGKKAKLAIKGTLPETPAAPAPTPPAK